MSEEKNTVSCTVSMPRELYKHLQAEAAYQDRSVSWLVAQAVRIRYGLGKKSPKPRKSDEPPESLSK